MVYIIAEIGNNHEGKIDLAMKCVSAAKKSGANAVKLQAIVPESLVNQNIRAERVNNLKKICLTFEEIEKVYKFSKELKIDFGVSFFDIETCLKFKCFDFAKIASSDCDNLLLLKTVIEKYDKVFISTGMLNNFGVKQLHTNLSKFRHQITVMHCISKYPTSIEEANLNLIDLLKSNFKNVGYSDHTDIIDISLMAMAKGCSIFEKHFTLDKRMCGIRNHQLSSDPTEFETYCNKLKKFEHALGLSTFDNRPELVDDSYLESKQSYYLQRNVLSGEEISMDDLVYQRPRQKGGVVNVQIEQNLIVKHDMNIGDLLKQSDLK